MPQATITIQNKLGLHARAANKLVDITTQFASVVSIEYNSKSIDGKSIMSVMLLAAAKGSELIITTQGSDEIEAMHAITQLINNLFDEGE
ncbi:MAG TPA: HPr family phosphocarrier protein [Cellvibrionales bacterium]|jgi:phosphocarrier protein|nr:HPr family phosphocarrier protein [Cellvibrionales bacterium]HAW14999.1 HPr family phosphocarrier protein [Cellvibrionales bacterium]HCX27355.1 HPr family phosphocarrier protein [Cellvibrionales bacterium]